MPSSEGLLTRSLLSRGEVVTVGDDVNHAAIAPVAIRLRYIGTGTVTSVTTTTATNIVAITSDGGTDTYAFETYATVGALVDKINADGIFEAIVLDTLRSYATASQFVDGAITSGTTLDGTVVWDVKVDTSAALYMAVCLDPKYREFLRPGKGHRVHLTGYEYYVNMGTAAADSEQVWIRKGSVETQVIGRLSIDSTLTQRSFASGNAKLTPPEDGQVIVIVKDAATLADAAGNYVQIEGIIE